MKDEILTPREEAVSFAVRLVCARRALDLVIKTAPLFAFEMKILADRIAKGEFCVIPRERNVTMVSSEKFRDSFVVTENLAKELDFVDYGVYEGFVER